MKAILSGNPVLDFPKLAMMPVTFGAMEYVKNFRDLEVYRYSRKLSGDIFALTRTFPKEEIYSLTDQVRRSARSIGAQIAEAWGKRAYEKHFVMKLTDADAEGYETQHWIETAHDCRYISDLQESDLLARCTSIGKMLNSMIEKAPSFCSKSKGRTKPKP